MKDFFLILLFLGLFGCALAPETLPPSGPGAPATDVPLLPAATLDQKIEVLEDRINDKSRPKKERELASNLLSTYKTLKKISAESLTDMQYRMIIRELFETLTLFDDNFISNKEIRPKDSLTVMRTFAHRRQEIFDGYRAKDYRGVINRFTELKLLFGSDAITPDINIVFALSLAREGLVKEAIDIGENIVKNFETTPDVEALRLATAKWKLGLGQEEAALSIYASLRETLDQEEANVKRLHKKILEAEASKPGLGAVEKGPKRTDDDVQKQLFQKVDRLIQEQKFEKAKELLSFRRSELLLEVAPTRKIQSIDRALTALDLAEEEHLQEKISRLSRDYKKRRTMESALKLVEEEKFQDAISKLDTLDLEQKEAPEAKKLRDLAVEMFINQERNRAAKMFLAAKKTHDFEKKYEYLLSSYNILKSLVDKYPLSPLILKVNSHIKVVKETLDKLPQHPQ